MTNTPFTSLNLSPDLLENLSSLGYHTMTPIQALSCPDILAGRDVIAQGKTGSGKTAAFGLGLLERLDVGRFRVSLVTLNERLAAYERPSPTATHEPPPHY